MEMHSRVGVSVAENSGLQYRMPANESRAFTSKVGVPGTTLNIKLRTGPQHLPLFFLYVFAGGGSVVDSHNQTASSIFGLIWHVVCASESLPSPRNTMAFFVLHPGYPAREPLPVRDALR